MSYRWFIFILVAGLTVYGNPDLPNPGFETDATEGWVGPWGYGALGGTGEGRIVSKGNGAFVRSGEQALKLEVRDDGNPSAVAWAGVSVRHPCVPGSKVRAGSWIYYSGEDSPPTEGLAMAQLRLEYFEDEFAEQLIPTHVTLSTPFSSSAGKTPESWHLVQVYDRVPPQARSLKFSILLLSQRPNNQSKKVWVDDAFLQFHRSRSQYGYEKPEHQSL